MEDGGEAGDALGRGRQLLIDGRFAEALALYEQELESRPGDPDLLNGMGAALRSLGRYDEANKCYERSLQADPRDRHSS